MAVNWRTPRIPLPKQTEQVHRDKKSDYDRRAGKAVSLEELNQGNHDEDRLEIFIASDQPEVCRYCGKVRTDFKEVGNRWLHTCPECGRSYWVEEE